MSHRARKWSNAFDVGIWPTDHRDDMSSAWSFFSFVQIFPTVLRSNNAVGTIWRDMSKPPQRRQGPYPRPLWLVVGTPLARARIYTGRAKPTLAVVFIYFFWYTVFITLDVCVMIFMASSLLLAVVLYKEDYWQIFKCVLFITQFLRSLGRLGSRTPVKTTPVGWLSSLQLTVLSRSAIVV